MKSDLAPADVVIVGGGFSGTMIAAHLGVRGLRVMLVEGGGRAARGTAYSTSDAVHLLNVPAANMSAWHDRPDDFVAAGVEPCAFAPRRDYGHYLRRILDRAHADGAELVEAKAVAAVRDGGDWNVTLDDGRVVITRALVLAQGNQPPEPMRLGAGMDQGLFVDNPWGQEARAVIERVAAEDGAVLIVGTGLTMVDLVLSLEAAGHRGPIVALSRRGQMPRSHAPYDAAPVKLDEVPQRNVVALCRWLRRRGAAVGWRAAVDALRPHTQAIWKGWSEKEQRRFLRHAQPYWDVHRHCIAPQVAGQLDAMIAEGRLEVVAGRLNSVREDSVTLLVSYSPRGSDVLLSPLGVRGSYSALFNCTGPRATGRTSDPLLLQMIDDGLIKVDGLGLGLAVDSESRAAEGVWALGPLTKGAFWEIVAVPDIRGQVAGVADQIARELEA